MHGIHSIESSNQKGAGMKNHKIAITLSHEYFSMLEGIIGKQGFAPRSKSQEVAWLIKQEWKRIQEEEREKTLTETLDEIKAFVSQMDKKAAAARILKEFEMLQKTADYVAPCHDTRIIQFPVGQIRQSLGSA
jgi:hypothetical protein